MFDIADVSVNVIILVLRIAVVCLLYFFLWQVVRVILRELRASQSPLQASGSPYGQLVVVSAGQTGLPSGKMFPLSPITIIGRSMESDVALNDNFLSAKHARLNFGEDSWTLEDLNSTNGTFVNGFEVRDATSVNEGDIIRIGRVEMKLIR
ncbi:MAG: FHA domain-containing protein [Chloroflexaceae bacterium]|nr:FHA domain-containing protein [Chloroflexaceae bacterium]